MIFKTPALIFFTVIFSISATAQNSCTDNITDIISSDLSISEKQIALDSLITSNKSNISSEELADCYHELGVRWYYRIIWGNNKTEENLEKILATFELSADLKRKANPINQKQLKRTLYNLGVFYKRNNEILKSIRSFTELINLQEINDQTLNAYRELGKALVISGDYFRATESFSKLIALAKVKPGYEKQLLQGYYRRADAYLSMDVHKFNNHIKFDLQKADSINNLQNWKGKRFFKEVWQLEGNRLLKTGAFDQAINYFKNLIAKQNETDSNNLTVINNSLGYTYLKTGNLAEAEKALKKSTSYDKSYSPAFENLAEYFAESEDFQKASQIYSYAISILLGEDYSPEDVIDSKKLEQVANKDWMLNHLTNFGKSLLKQYQKNKDQQLLLHAIQLFKTADKLVDIIRFGSYELKSKYFWREKSAALYLNAVEAAFLIEKPELAYYFIEKNKAILLLEDISENEAIENANIPYSLIAKELKLKKSITFLQRLQQSDKINKDSISQKLYEIKSTHSQFIDSIGTAFPVYASLKKQIEITPLNKFRDQLITNGQSTIHYILGESKGFGLINTINGTSLFQINEVAQLQKELIEITRRSGVLFKRTEDITSYQKLANAITDKLFPEGFLSQQSGQDIKIIPDYTLQMLSFETLMQADKYLIEDFIFSYAYSITHLLGNSERNRNATKDFISFAPVSFESDELPTLPNSENEVKTLQKITNGEVLLKDEATKNQFLNNSNEYKILHLSTHADIGNEVDPWIAFSDDKLTLSELHALKNQAEMVVLSACNTSIGTIQSGEGILSLARGFSNAGANSIVSSLWPTNDKANMEIMTAFYSGLDKGLSKSDALRTAKLQYLENHSGTEISPYYWGSLTITGNNDSISFTSDSNLVFILLGILTLIVGTVVIRKKRKASNA